MPALDMTGHQTAAMRIMVATSGAGLIVMIGATSAFGVWGAAVTATVSPLVMKAAMALHLYRAEAIDITASSKIRELLARLGAAAGQEVRKPRSRSVGGAEGQA
jgi:hypothetical protein